MVSMILLLGLVLSTVAVGAGPSPRLGRYEREAEADYLRALRCLERGDLEQRREGLRALEEAVRLAPSNPDYRLALAQAYFAGGYYHAARRGYERAAQAESSAAYLNLGLWWRHEWLESREGRALDRAVDALMTAAWLKPLDSDAWLLLVPLYLAQRKPEEAASAAFGALVADSKRLEAHLAVAATLCHLGVLGLGDSIFRATIPRLPEGLRARFEAVAPLPPGPPTVIMPPSAEAGEGSGALSPAITDRLESWSRLTEQYILLPGPGANASEVAADLRARFGAPEATRQGPVGQCLRWGEASCGDGPSRGTVWQYADLGVRIVILDRLLVLRPDLPDSKGRDAVALPGSALLAMYRRVLAALGGAPGLAGDGAPGAGAPSGN
jgi:tetratricopeptide (TPR) repeat protein